MIGGRDRLAGIAKEVFRSRGHQILLVHDLLLGLGDRQLQNAFGLLEVGCVKNRLDGWRRGQRRDRMDGVRTSGAAKSGDIRVKISEVFSSERCLLRERAVTRTPPIFSVRYNSEKRSGRCGEMSAKKNKRISMTYRKDGTIQFNVDTRFDCPGEMENRHERIRMHTRSNQALSSGGSGLDGLVLIFRGER